jgi:dihydroorotate dehydrogenase
MPPPFYRIIRKALFALGPERSHTLAGTALRLASGTPGLSFLLRRLHFYRHPALEMEVFGLRFPNPIGLATGFDKDARFIRGTPLIGMGFTEVGTVTPLPQPGHPRPRLYRLPEQEALINRMGFNNSGARAMESRLAGLEVRGRRPIPVGVNLGKNLDTPLADAVSDYLTCAEMLYPHADYLVINVSSPNTPGLRDLQAPHLLSGLVAEIVPRIRSLDRANGGAFTPVLVKLSPDEDPDMLPEIVEVARQSGIDGFVATNTTRSRAGLAKRWQMEAGGLSGTPLRAVSTEVVAHIYRLTGGALPIIGVGGISTPENAYQRIRAGASLIQIYTGMIYEGPALAGRICRGLVALLQRDGFNHLSEAVGADHR